MIIRAYPITLILAVLWVGVCEAPVTAGGTVSLQLIGEVPLSLPPGGYVRNVFLSPSGKEMLLECVPYGDVCPVISLDESGQNFSVSQRSRSDGTWDTGEKISATAKDRAQSLGTTEKGVATGEMPSGTVEGIIFEDGTGRPVQQGITLFTLDEARSRYENRIYRPGVWQLFLVDGASRVQVTSPPVNWVRKFNYDPLRRRVLARAGDCDEWITFDVGTGTRRLLSCFDSATRTDMSYYLIPGADNLLVRYARLDAAGHDYNDVTLKLTDLDGKIISEIPVAPEGVTEKTEPLNITVSKDFLAFVSGRDNRGVVKLFKIIHEQQ